MSLMFRILMQSKARSNHHRIALDALRQVRGPEAEGWRNLFLKHHAAFFDGAKAPDTKFKDFQNHVCHVGDTFWGGAPDQAERWYERTVSSLWAEDWPAAVYNAGVLSHYITDPCQPFHTGQSPAEDALHGPVERSFSAAYGEMQAILETDLGGYPSFEAPQGEGWVGDLVRQGAVLANRHYQLVVDHYDLDKGVKNPVAGLDQEIKDAIAGMIGYAAVAYARVLERAFQEAAVSPPRVDLTLQSLVQSLQMPVNSVLKKLDAAADKKAVEAIYAEFKETGRVVNALSEDDGAIRAQHAREVLGREPEDLLRDPPPQLGRLHGEGKPARKRPTKVRAGSRPVVSAAPLRLDFKFEGFEPKRRPKPVELPAPSAELPEPLPTPKAETAPEAAPAERAPVEPVQVDMGPTEMGPAEMEPAERIERQSAARRPRLSPEDPLEDAPSIGPKTAARFAKIGVTTVGELLAIDPEKAAAALNVRHITPEAIREWRAQALLQCAVPGLAGHDAQILTGCGVSSAEELARANPQDILARAAELLATSQGKRLIREGQEPDLEEVESWIEEARQIA